MWDLSPCSCLWYHGGIRRHLTTSHSTTLPSRLQHMSETYGTFWVQQIFCCCFFFPSCNVTRTCLRLQIEDLSCWMTVLREEQNYSQRGLQEGKKDFPFLYMGNIWETFSPNSRCHLLPCLGSLSLPVGLWVTLISCQPRKSPQASGSLILPCYLSKRFSQNLARRKKIVKRTFPYRLQRKLNVFLLHGTKFETN